MVKNNHSQHWVLMGFLFLLTIEPSWALLRIHDTRYTLLPDPFVPDRAFFSGGFHTKWIGDGDFIGSTQFGINDHFEVGGKFSFNTEKRFDRNYFLLNLGVRYAMFHDDYLQLDGVVGINNDPGTSLVLSYGLRKDHTKKISNLIETRVGILGAVAQDQWAKFEVGAYPSIKITDAVAMRMGTALGTTMRHPIDSFQFYLFPGIQAGLLPHLSIIGEYAINIIGSGPNRIALHLSSMF